MRRFPCCLDGCVNSAAARRNISMPLPPRDAGPVHETAFECIHWPNRRRRPPNGWSRRRELARVLGTSVRRYPVRRCRSTPAVVRIQPCRKNRAPRVALRCRTARRVPMVRLHVPVQELERHRGEAGVGDLSMWMSIGGLPTGMAGHAMPLFAAEILPARAAAAVGRFERTTRARGRAYLRRGLPIGYKCAVPIAQLIA